MKIAAVDPGKSGGLAFLESANLFSSVNGNTLSVYKNPGTEGDLIEILRSESPDCLYLEKVSGFIGNNNPGSRAFVLGDNFGFLKGVIMTLNITLHLVTPPVWMKAMNLGTRGERTPVQWKNHLKAEAQRLYPKEKVTLLTADALLLLEYARLRELGQLQKGTISEPAHSSSSI